MGRLSWCIRVVYHRGKTQLVYRGCVSQREDSAGVSGLCITDEKFSWCIQGRVSQSNVSRYFSDGVCKVIHDLMSGHAPGRSEKRDPTVVWRVMYQTVETQVVFSASYITA